MDNEQVHNTNIPDTALIALDIFTSVIRGKIEAYTVLGHNQADLRKFNALLRAPNL